MNRERERERERACTIYFKLEPSNQTKAGFKFGKMFVLLLVENVVLINQSIDTHSRKKIACSYSVIYFPLVEVIFLDGGASR